MKKRLLIAIIAIPAIIVTAMAKNFASMPFDYFRSLFSRPELGAELHVTMPQNYPSIGGLVISRTMSGTNVEILGR